MDAVWATIVKLVFWVSLILLAVAVLRKDNYLQQTHIKDSDDLYLKIMRKLGFAHAYNPLTAVPPREDRPDKFFPDE